MNPLTMVVAATALNNVYNFPMYSAPKILQPRKPLNQRQKRKHWRQSPHCRVR